MRVFVAVEISEEVRQKVAARIDFLRSEFSDLRVGWEKPEKLHLTMKFLGETPPEKLADLEDAVRKSVNDIQPFEVEIGGTGIFPPRSAARVLWLGVNDESGSLLEINKQLETECEKIGFSRENRSFRPHLTIARLKEPGKSKSLAALHLETDFAPVTFSVNSVTVFQSVLHPTGSRYSALFKQGIE